MAGAVDISFIRPQGLPVKFSGRAREGEALPENLLSGGRAREGEALPENLFFP
jgi:hypothetical protein